MMCAEGHYHSGTFKVLTTAPTTPKFSTTTTISFDITFPAQPERRKLSEIVPLSFGNRRERRKRAAELRRMKR